MRRFLMWPAVPALLVVVFGCGRGKDQSHAGPAESTQIPEMSAYELGRPIQSGNLAVVPVIYKNPMPEKGEDYATLAEAMKHDWIEIMEMPGGEVGILRVRNTGPKPLLLLGGELLVGGKQDRVVAKDVVIQPKETADVAVNCVEHGRWTGTSNKFDSGGTMVPLSVRDEAMYGNQQRVWDRVGQFNEQAKAAAGVTTIRGGLANEDLQRKVGSGLDAIVSGLGSNQNVVGVIIAVNGRPQTLELFGSASLFESARDSILKGALAEVALSDNGNAQAPSMSDCTAFFSDCMNAQRRRRETDGNMNTFSADAANIRGAEIAGKDYEAKPAAKAGGLVHGTYSRSADR